MDNIVNVEASLPGESFVPGWILRDHEDVRADPAQFVPYVRVETDDQTAFEQHVQSDERVTDLVALDSTEERTL